MIHYKIREKVAQTGRTLQEIADVIHVNKSTISKFLKGEHELKFESMFLLISSLFPLNEQSEAFGNTFLYVTNKRNIKCALEFFAANMDTESLITIIEKNMLRFKDLQELFDLYEVFAGYRKGELTTDQAYKIFAQFEPSTDESKVVHKVFLLYWYAKYKQFKEILFLKDQAFKALDELEDGYFKTSLRNQLLQIYLNYYTHNNDREEWGKILNLLEGNFTNHFNQGLVLHSRALYYQWVDCEKAIDKFKECISFYYEVGADMYGDFVKREGLFLIMLYDNRDISLSDVNKAPDYIQAYYHYKKEEMTKSRELLEKCKSRIIAENDLSTLPYQFYLEGLITQDVNYFWLSMYQFFAEGDLLFATLPIEELKKRGLSGEMIGHLLKTEREKKLLPFTAPPLY